MESRAAIFSKPARDFMRAMPLAVGCGTPIGVSARF